MILYLIVVCDTNHSNHRVERVHGFDIDHAAAQAKERWGGREIVKAVVEYVPGEVGEIIAALRKELA